MAERAHVSPAKKEREESVVDTHVNVRSIALTIIAAASTMYILHWAQEVFIPIVLSILISYALEPVVLWLMRGRFPRTLASAVVVGSLAAGTAFGGYALADDAAAIVEQLPEAAVKLREAMRAERSTNGSTIRTVERAAEELQKTADAATGSKPVPPRGVQRVQIEEPAINIRQYLSWGSASLVAFAGQAVLIVFFVFFLLASGDLFKRKLVRLAGPSLEKKKITVQILDEINTQIERFLFVRVVTSVVVGVATWLAFRMVGLEHAGVWGMAAGIFNSIPYFGPVIVAAGTAVVAFLQFGTVGMATFVAGVSLVITSIEGWILTPWLTSRASRTNEVGIFIGLIFWGFIWGIWGTLLAVPMLVAVKACCDHIEDLQPVGELLGD
ncbi:MAG TPA: AI-2E family transporter [Vicinamibacterales bacterium]|nr:AI-2E family transporter [Vicinamibacterales bacterium]